MCKITSRCCREPDEFLLSAVANNITNKTLSRFIITHVGDPKAFGGRFVFLSTNVQILLPNNGAGKHTVRVD